MIRFPARTIALLLLLPLVAPAISSFLGGCGTFAIEAQDEVDWQVEGELGASVFFGNTSQTTINTRLATSRADSTYDFSTLTRFNYGEAEGADGDAFVAKRSWDVEASLDWWPFARVSPFAFGQGTSSFERRIDFRYNVGGGAKLTFIRSETSRVDLSAAVLAEQTFVRDDPERVDEPDESLLARLSVRFRGRREFDEGRVILSSENFYRPVVGEYGNYVVESRNSVSFTLSESLSLKFSFIDTYDSRAEERGADTNNDGQLIFSLLSTF